MKHSYDGKLELNFLPFHWEGKIVELVELFRLLEDYHLIEKHPQVNKVLSLFFYSKEGKISARNLRTYRDRGGLDNRITALFST